MITNMLIRARAIAAGLLAATVVSAFAADMYMVVLDPSDLKWGDTGPQFPNTQLVILDGDAGKKGPVTLRFRCPDNHKILAHTHPGTERVTVLQGTMLIGIGKKYDAANLKEVKTGGYFVIPAREPHYADCMGDTIIEVHTDGPLGTTYVNPAEDPSKK